MSTISNEHQSGSPFDREPEPSEPGCICGRGVRCPLHGGPPQPGPEPMTTEHQPGSPGVDLDALERRLELDLGSWGNLNTYRRVFAELRTLRARVGELEEARRADILRANDRLERVERSLYLRLQEVESERDAATERITDLESQLAAAREAARFFESHMDEWCDECPGNWATDGHVEGCGTGQASERHRAILAVEKAGPDEG